MPLSLSGWEIAGRLLWSIVAGALIGLNRDEQGRPAGLRTNILVCVAAALAMIQANLLLATAGKTPGSFGVLDLMRLPLGILSGMGFIGAGAILRRDGLVLGVTTAATLWIVTVLGLCFGGGQWRLGAAGLVLTLIVLVGFKKIEILIEHVHQGELVVTSESNRLKEGELQTALEGEGYRIVARSVAFAPAAQRDTFIYEVRWRGRGRMPAPALMADLRANRGVLALRWQPKPP